MRWSAQNEPGRLLPACAEVASRPQLALRLPAPQFLRITRTAGDHPKRTVDVQPRADLISRFAAKKSLPKPTGELLRITTGRRLFVVNSLTRNGAGRSTRDTSDHRRLTTTPSGSWTVTPVSSSVQISRYAYNVLQLSQSMRTTQVPRRMPHMAANHGSTGLGITGCVA
jgi:hypothetical protein